MDGFNLRKFNEKRSIVLKFQIGLQLWKIWILRWILIVHGKLLEKI
jgi:hypothetical protein